MLSCSRNSGNASCHQRHERRLQSVSGETHDGSKTSRDGESTSGTSESSWVSSGGRASTSCVGCAGGNSGGSVGVAAAGGGSDPRDRLGDRARAVSDGKGGGLGDGVGLAVVDKSGGCRAGG